MTTSKDLFIQIREDEAYEEADKMRHMRFDMALYKHVPSKKKTNKEQKKN